MDSVAADTDVVDTSDYLVTDTKSLDYNTDTKPLYKSVGHALESLEYYDEPVDLTATDTIKA